MCIYQHTYMPNRHKYSTEVEHPSITHSKQVRVDLTISQADYDRLRDLASTAEMTNASTISTALSIGLNVLEGPGGLDLLEGVAMLRFLRGRP